MDVPFDRAAAAWWCGILGDALGSPLNGLGKGHIRAALGKIDGYIDAWPALKGKETRWKKPGLYTAASQMALVVYLADKEKRKGDTGFISHIAAASRHGSGPHGIFRHPDLLLREMIRRCAALDEGGNDAPSGRAADLAPPLLLFLPFATHPFRRSGNLVLDTLAFAAMVTRDEYAAAGSAIMVSVLASLLGASTVIDGVADLVIEAAKTATEAIAGNPPRIFDLKFNPQRMAEKSLHLLRAMEIACRGEGPGTCEKEICEHAGNLLGHTITHASVNHPLTLLPFALSFFKAHIGVPRDALFRAAEEGGAAGTLASTVGVLLGAHLGVNAVPQRLRDGLVNRGRMEQYVERASSALPLRFSMEEFLDSESALTVKEQEELNARLRHVKTKEKKPKVPRDRENSLNRHVVESWTKLDRAKWRKRDREDYSE